MRERERERGRVMDPVFLCHELYELYETVFQVELV
jgi:hypothetical protein